MHEKIVFINRSWKMCAKTIGNSYFCPKNNPFQVWRITIMGLIHNQTQFSLKILTLFSMGLFRAAHGYMGRGAKSSPSLKTITICSTMKLGSFSLPKEDPKNMWITWHIPWILLTSAFIHWKSAIFAISRNADIDSILIHYF